MIRLVCETSDGPKKLQLPFASTAPLTGLFDAVVENRRAAGDDWSGLFFPRAMYSLWLMQVDAESKKLRPVQEVPLSDRLDSFSVDALRSAVFMLKARRSLGGPQPLESSSQSPATVGRARSVQLDEAPELSPIPRRRGSSALPCLPHETEVDPSPSPLTYRERLVALCAKYSPESLPQVDAVLLAFAGREEALIQQTVKRYGPEPPASGNSLRGASPEKVQSFVRTATASAEQMLALMRKKSSRVHDASGAAGPRRNSDFLMGSALLVHSSSDDDDDEADELPKVSSMIRRTSSVARRRPPQRKAHDDLSLAPDLGLNSPDLVPVHRQNYLRQLLQSHGDFASATLRQQVMTTTNSSSPTLSLFFVSNILQCLIQNKQERLELSWAAIRSARQQIEREELDARTVFVEKLMDPTIWLIQFHDIIRLCFTHSALVVLRESIIPEYWGSAHILAQQMSIAAEFVQRCGQRRAEVLGRQAMARQEFFERESTRRRETLIRTQQKAFASLCCDEVRDTETIGRMLLRREHERLSHNLRLTQVVVFEAWMREERAVVASEAISRCFIIRGWWVTHVALLQRDLRAREALHRIPLTFEMLEVTPRSVIEFDRYIGIIALSREAVFVEEFLGRRDIHFEVFHTARHASERRLLATTERIKRLPTEIREKIARRMLEHRRFFAGETICRKIVWRDERSDAKQRLHEASAAVRIAVEKLEAREFEEIKGLREHEYFGFWVTQLEAVEEPLARSSHFVAEMFDFCRIQQFEIQCREIARWRALVRLESCAFIDLSECFGRERMTCISQLQVRVLFFKHWEQQRRLLHRDSFQRRLFPLLKNLTESHEEVRRREIRFAFRLSFIVLQMRHLTLHEDMCRYENICYSEAQWFERIVRRKWVYQWHIQWHDLLIRKFMPDWIVLTRMPIAQEEELQRVIVSEHIRRKMIMLERSRMQHNKFSFEFFFFFGEEIARRGELASIQVSERRLIRLALKEIIDSNERLVYSRQLLAERLSQVPFHELDRWEAIGRLWIEEVLEPVAADILEQRQMMNDVLHERRGIFKEFVRSLHRLQIRGFILEEAAERRALYNRSADAHYDRWNFFMQTSESITRRAAGRQEADTMTRHLARYSRLLMMPFRRADFRVEHHERMTMAFQMLVEGEALIRAKIRSNGLGVLVRKWTAVNEYAQGDTDRYQQQLERERKLSVAQKAAEERAAARRAEQQERRRAANIKRTFEQRNQELRNSETQDRFRQLEDERKVRIVMLMQLSFEISKTGGRMSTVIVPRLKHLQDEIQASNLTHLLARHGDGVAGSHGGRAKHQSQQQHLQPPTNSSLFPAPRPAPATSTSPRRQEAPAAPPAFNPNPHEKIALAHQEESATTVNVETSSMPLPVRTQGDEAPSSQKEQLQNVASNSFDDSPAGDYQQANSPFQRLDSGSYEDAWSEASPLLGKSYPRYPGAVTNSPIGSVPLQPSRPGSDQFAEVVANLLLGSFVSVREHVLEEEKTAWDRLWESMASVIDGGSLEGDGDDFASYSSPADETGDDNDNEGSLSIDDQLQLLLEDEVCLRQDVAREAAKRFRLLCKEKAADTASMYLPFPKYEALLNHSLSSRSAIVSTQLDELAALMAAEAKGRIVAVTAASLRIGSLLADEGLQQLHALCLVCRVLADEIHGREALVCTEALHSRLLLHGFAVAAGRILTSVCDVLASEETFQRARLEREETSTARRLVLDSNRSVVVRSFQLQEETARLAIVTGEQHHRTAALRLAEASERRVVEAMEDTLFANSLVRNVVFQEEDSYRRDLEDQEESAFCRLATAFARQVNSGDTRSRGGRSPAQGSCRPWLRSGSGAGVTRRMAEVLLDIEAFTLPGREQAAREGVQDDEEAAWLELMEQQHEHIKGRSKAPTAIENLRRALTDSRDESVVNGRNALMSEALAAHTTLQQCEAQQRAWLYNTSSLQLSEALRRGALQSTESDQRLQLVRKERRQHPATALQRLATIPLREQLCRQVSIQQEAGRRAVFRSEKTSWENLCAAWSAPLKLSAAEQQSRSAIAKAEADARRALAAAAEESRASAGKALPPLRRGGGGGTAHSPPAMQKRPLEPQSTETRRAQSVSPVSGVTLGDSGPIRSRPALPAIVVSPHIRRQIIWGDDQPIPPLNPREQHSRVIKR
jgi:hypothetical protein